MNPKFFYVYVLRSHKDSGFYIGFTQNLLQRYQTHQQGQVKSTQNRRPFSLIFYEAYRNKYDAIRREKHLKSARGRTTLKYMLREFFQNQ